MSNALTTAPGGPAAGATPRDGGNSGKAAARKRRPRAGDAARAGGAALYRRWWVPLLWVAPAVVAVVTFGIYPFLNTILLSFTNAKPMGGAVRFVGWDNYATLLTDSAFWQSTANSLLYLVCVVPLMMLLPLLLAVLVSKQVRGIGFFRSAYYLPAVCSTVVVGLAWQMLLASDGQINTILTQLRVVQEALPFLSDRWLILFSAMVLTLWKGLGYYMVLYMAALANVEPALHEAAQTDGAGALRRFWHITLPGVRVMMYLVGVLSAIGALRVFTEIYVLGGDKGGPGGLSATLPFYIRSVGLDPLAGNLGVGGAASVALFLLTFGFILLSQKLSAKSEES
ncbi:carbohydrate ABC transporter permease [Specibacter sp. NPDC057265]|uniref:carbohydrate ABC transporter permease n=1 Tax=Specibacter sp. NPDC057265 TaxID=3346075 RepID=UPI0036282A02